MLDAEKLAASAEACLGWPYASPGSCDSRGIDCSGLLVKAFRDQGGSIYHGSNTIYRSHCAEKGRLTADTRLLPGMAVFKWNPNTPDKFQDGLGDFQHVGLVTSVNPLRIVHASSAAGCVTVDTARGSWQYWGWLRAVKKPEPADPPPAETPPAKGPRVEIVSPGGRVNIRRGDGESFRRIRACEPGTRLEYVAAAANGWVAVRTGKEVGWVSPRFCRILQGE